MLRQIFRSTIQSFPVSFPFYFAFTPCLLAVNKSSLFIALATAASIPLFFVWRHYLPSLWMWVSHVITFFPFACFRIDGILTDFSHSFFWAFCFFASLAFVHNSDRFSATNKWAYPRRLDIFSCWFNVETPINMARLGTVGGLTILAMVIAEAGRVEDVVALPMTNPLRRQAIVWVFWFR